MPSFLAGFAAFVLPAVAFVGVSAFAMASKPVVATVRPSSTDRGWTGRIYRTTDYPQSRGPQG